MKGHGRRELAPRVADHPFFQGLPRALVAAAESQAVDRTYAAGDLLVREGDPAEEFLVIFHGKVALEVVSPERPRLTIQTIGPGEVLGWSWLTPPHHWRLDARALKPTRVAALPAGALRARFAQHPSEGYQFLLRLLPVIAGRLESTRVQLLDIHGV